MPFDVKPLPGGIGTEVLGLEPGGHVGADTAAALRRLWLDAGIVLFRGIGTSPEALLALSRCFGELEIHPIERFRLAGYPELILLTNKDGPTGPVYDFDGEHIHGRIPWHTDLAFTTTPNAGALLRMVQKTANGGETGWLDTARAWDELDQATKQRIEGLEAVYHFSGDLEEMRFNKPGGVRLNPSRSDYPHFPPVAHPLVWIHPETGRRVLNVSTLNIRGIVGLEPEEGDALIGQLIAHALQPRLQYVHAWENDDIMLWDNRRTMHCAFGHPVEQVRIVQRSTIRGTVAMGRLLQDAQG
ncbi:MAG: TauD/TfdA family dioxygenase [Pseudomonadales bacterium]|nr:TauD/TfdA family dioxygenase [Pseudomonadales bacterium]